jgi:hypothetical protein
LRIKKETKKKKIKSEGGTIKIPFTFYLAPEANAVGSSSYKRKKKKHFFANNLECMLNETNQWKNNRFPPPIELGWLRKKGKGFLEESNENLIRRPGECA